MIISRTPFRISFFGGGTDYPEWYTEHGGRTLAATIDKYTYISVRKLPPFHNHKTRVVWSKIELVNSHDEIEHPAVKGILRFMNIQDGLEIHHDGDLPARSGVGGSSAFVVGFLHALYTLMGIGTVQRMDLARNAISIERDIMGEVVGCQDQVSCAFGGLNRIVIEKPGRISVEPFGLGLPGWYRKERLSGLNDRLMLYFTGVTRSASEAAKEQLANLKKNGRALSQMAAQVDEGFRILESGELDDFGRLLHEAWLLKRSLSGTMSTRAIDDLYDQFRKSGALGGKICGAGSGGFLVLYAPPETHPIIRRKFGPLLVQVPFRFDDQGASIVLSTKEGAYGCPGDRAHR